MWGFRNLGLENQIIYDDEDDSGCGGDDGDKIIRSMFYKFEKRFFLKSVTFFILKLKIKECHMRMVLKDDEVGQSEKMEKNNLDL